MTSTGPGDAAGRGGLTVAPTVVSAIAGVAVREARGVYSVGAGATKAVSALRERIPGAGRSSPSAGVQVEVGERQAAIDVDVVVEYGARIAEVAADLRARVIRAVEQYTGLEVIEVNVAVNDIHLPADDAPAPAVEAAPAGRVQ